MNIEQNPQEMTPVLELANVRFAAHFGDVAADELTTFTKVFPESVRPDLEDAVARLLAEHGARPEFVGISGGHGYRALKFTEILTQQREPMMIGPPEYLDIEVGSAAPARCPVTGAWLFHIDGAGQRAGAALLVSQANKMYGETPGVRLEAIYSPGAGGRDAAQALLGALARHLTGESVYRGRALSFETERSYHGGLGDLKVHDLPEVTLDDVILPQATLAVLERTVFGFVAARDRLRAMGFSTKRGLLLHGPPGTGKTHFIRYLLSALEGHTSLLVTAEQVAAFNEVMAIARALQPSVVVIEDADLLARAREDRDSDCSQVLLNSLLNHMDGLTDSAEIIFILTTNRPETLEPAVRDRPGRIDQVIEIPAPDAPCRARLLTLYLGGMEIEAGTAEACVARTEGVSAAFMRELARRMAQFAIQRGAEDIICAADMHLAFDEMLGAGHFSATALGAGAMA